MFGVVDETKVEDDVPIERAGQEYDGQVINEGGGRGLFGGGGGGGFSRGSGGGKAVRAPVTRIS